MIVPPLNLLSDNCARGVPQGVAKTRPLSTCSSLSAYAARKHLRGSPRRTGRSLAIPALLDFRSAEQVFRQWQREEPRDPFGPMSAAATALFGRPGPGALIKSA